MLETSDATRCRGTLLPKDGCRLPMVPALADSAVRCVGARPLGILLLAVLLITAAMPSWCRVSGSERPNVLLAISDDQSYPHTSAYGCREVHTPAFDCIARMGVLFSNAMAASCGCSPSRASLLIGRHPWQNEHAGTHASYFAPKYAVFPDLLEAAGYFVGFTGKGWGPGDWKSSGRVRNPAGTEFNQAKLDPPYNGIRSTDYAGNFARFLAARPAEKPFCFWYGAGEPHRAFQPGSGVASGKQIDAVDVPPFLPDTLEIRSDLLDYFVEVEWFDSHLGRMLDMLREAGELDNTLIIVTSDNGMAFPRAKANLYEYGIHVPLAISWKDNVPAGRVIDDLVGFVDLTATILDAADIQHPSEALGELPPSGRSILGALKSTDQGIVEAGRDHALSSRERHSSSRYKTLGYPQRALRMRQYLYIHNFAPERWPAGAPQKYGVGTYAAPGTETSLGPMHAAYHDIDGCPSLTFLVDNRDDPHVGPFFHLAVDKRPAEELYDIRKDPGCLVNLAADQRHAELTERLRTRLFERLRATSDPRVLGHGDVFETYRRVSRIRRFPPPPHASN